MFVYRDHASRTRLEAAHPFLRDIPAIFFRHTWSKLSIPVLDRVWIDPSLPGTVEYFTHAQRFVEAHTNKGAELCLI